jgi:hypothetical protein
MRVGVLGTGWGHGVLGWAADPVPRQEGRKGLIG